MLEKLACRLGRKDEQPNIELALELCNSEDAAGIKEIRDGLMGNDAATANDCIKVLYEIGYRKPHLIAGYAEDFVSLLASKNNRLVWGGMTALGTVAELSADLLFRKFEAIKSAYDNGSVITRDNSISVFAGICKASRDYNAAVFPTIIEHLRTCRPKELPQHAERAAAGVSDSNKDAFFEVLNTRIDTLTPPQRKRVDALINKLQSQGR
ncbi:MAG: hypothetical protein FWG53_09350 [Clostridiales bacterium]|nr:hypothetical protein [Clostridiales bacterium]